MTTDKRKQQYRIAQQKRRAKMDKRQITGFRLEYDHNKKDESLELDFINSFEGTYKQKIRQIINLAIQIKKAT